MRIGFIFGVVAVLFTSVTAHAQTVVHGRDVTVYRTKTTLDFGPVSVDGEPEKPQVLYVNVRNKAKFGELIRLRANFSPELRKSLDQL
jgi:hypothetical protein